MIARPHPVRYTYRDYLAIEARGGTKHEFLDGQIYAMAGGTIEHATLAATVSALLHNALRGRPRRVASSDLHVRVLATNVATYPDVAVICGPWERD